MPAKTHGERLDRLERGHRALQKQLAATDARIERRFDRVAKQFEETDRRMRETDAHLKKLGEETDERIDKLVLAIGELISRYYPAKG